MDEWLTGPEGVKALGPFWPQLREALTRLHSETEFDVVELVGEGRAQVWLAPEQSVLVTVVEDDQLILWLAAGEYAPLEGLARQAVAFARGLSLRRVMVYGRKGWARSFLCGMGFVEAYTVMAADLWAK